MISSPHQFLTIHNSDLRKTNKNLQIHSLSLNHSTVHGHLTKDSFSFFLSFFLTVLVAKLCSTLFSLSMGFSRQEYWSGLPLLSPGDLPNPGIEPESPALARRILTTEPAEKPLC